MSAASDVVKMCGSCCELIEAANFEHEIILRGGRRVRVSDCFGDPQKVAAKYTRAGRCRFAEFLFYDGSRLIFRWSPVRGSRLTAI